MYLQTKQYNYTLSSLSNEIPYMYIKKPPV